MSPRETNDADVARLVVQVAHLQEGACELKEQVERDDKRITVLEHDQTKRIAVQATIGAVLTVAVAIAGSGVVGAVDTMRQELRQAAQSRATLKPLPPSEVGR